MRFFWRFSLCFAALCSAQLTDENYKQYKTVALATLQKYPRQAAEAINVLLSQRPYDTELWCAMAEFYSTWQRNFEAAEDLLKSCFKFARDEEGRFFCLRAQCKIALDKRHALVKTVSDNDINVCMDALKMRPDSFEVLKYVGDVKHSRHEHAEAGFYYEKARELGYDDKDFWYQMCQNYANEGRCEKALACYKKMVKENPEDDMLKEMVGRVLTVCEYQSTETIGYYTLGMESYAKGTHGYGCEEFKVEFDTQKMATKSTVLHEGGNVMKFDTHVFPENAQELDPKYFKPNLTFIEKEVRVLEMENFMVHGLYEVMMKGAPDCAFVVGDHLHNNPIRIEQHSESSDTAVVPFDEPVAVINQPFMYNYYHVVMEGLARAIFLNQTVPRPANGRKMKLVYLGWVDTFTEGLKMLGLDKHFELVKSAAPALHKYKKAYIVNWEHKDVKYNEEPFAWHTVMPPAYAVHTTRKWLSKAKKPFTAKDKRNWNIVYLRRRADSDRGVVPSDDALAAALKNLVGEDHFVDFGKGPFPLKYQIDVFSRTAVIVGGHGAGFSNMIWMAPKSSAVIFPLRPISDTCFAYLAGVLDIDYYETPFFHSFYHGKYQMNDFAVQHVVDTVQRALQEHGFPVKNPIVPPEYKPIEDNLIEDIAQQGREKARQFYETFAGGKCEGESCK